MERWPLGIAAGLGIMVLMNLVFAYLAVTHAPEVSPSYTHTQDR